MAHSAHPLLVFSRPDHDRAAVVSWVREAVAEGERVILRFAPTVPLGAGPDAAAGTGVLTLTDDLVRAGVDRAVIDSGQVQFLDAARLRAVTGGRHRALGEVYVELVARARRAGYSGLAVTSDGAALRASARGKREMCAHEQDLDRLSCELPLRALCRFGVDEEREWLVDMAGVHHRATTDVLWDAELARGCLSVRGEIDGSNADRFAAVLHAARLTGTRRVDLSGLRFCAAAGFDVLAAAAASSPGDRPLVLRNPDPRLARLLRLAGLPGAGVRIEVDGGDRELSSPGRVPSPMPGAGGA